MLVEFSKNIARFRGHNIMFPLLFVLLLTSSAHAEPLSYLGIRYTPQPLRFQASGPALPFDKTENHDDFGMYIRKQPGEGIEMAMSRVPWSASTRRRATPNIPIHTVLHILHVPLFNPNLSP